jgi:hypothetical protein
VLAHLDHLFAEEIRHVTDSIRKETHAFCSHVASPSVSIMVGKGLVWTPGGQHDQVRCPFSF